MNKLILAGLLVIPSFAALAADVESSEQWRYTAAPNATNDQAVHTASIAPIKNRSGKGMLAIHCARGDLSLALNVDRNINVADRNLIRYRVDEREEVVAHYLGGADIIDGGTLINLPNEYIERFLTDILSGEETVLIGFYDNRQSATARFNLAGASSAISQMKRGCGLT